MKWLARCLVLLLAVAVLAGVGAVVAPGLLKPRVEAAASRALGREVTIADLSLRPAWPPTLVASGVRADGLGTLARAEASLAPGSLLDGAPRVATLRLVRPDVVAGATLDGPPPSHRHGQSSQPAAPAPEAPRAPLVGQVTVEDGRLAFADPRTGRLLAASVSGTLDLAARAFSLHLDAPAQGGYPAATIALHGAAGQRTHADVAFDLHGKPVRLSIDAGPADDLTLRQPTHLTVAAESPGITLTAGGTVARAGFDLVVAVRAQDEAALAALLGWPAGASGPLALNGQVAGDRAHVALHDLALLAPQGDLAGDAQVTLGPRASLTGTLASKRLDLDAVLTALPRRPAASAEPSATTANAAPAPTTIIPDGKLPFAALDRADADLHLTAAALRFAGVDYSNLSGHLMLRDGRLALDPFSAVLPGGAHLQASLRLDGRAAPPTAALVLHAPSVALAPLLAALHLPPLASGTGSLDADLRSAGATAHNLAASLNGTAALHAQDGAIDASLLSVLLDGARLPIRLPSGPARLRCLAVAAAAHSGVLDLAPLVVDADRLRIDGGGAVDLGQETLALQLRPLLRAGPGLVVPVRVEGPWRTPKVVLGAEGGSGPPGADHDACPAGARTPASGAQPGRKLPKAIDVLRGLLR